MSLTRSKKAPVNSRRESKRASAVYTEEQMKFIFGRCDIDRDGYLSKKELKKALSDLGVDFPSLRAVSVLWHADADEDGYISKNELAELVKYTSTLSADGYY